MFDFGWIDAHCHFAEPRINEKLEQEISEATELGVTGFISFALGQEEYEWHQQADIPQMMWGAGIHPYYDKSSEDDFDLLIKLCDEKKIIAVGEIGLDKREDNFAWQKNILLQQLDLARSYDLPVVFHVVKQYYELLKLLKNNFPKVRGYLHSFNPSLPIAEEFSRFDLAFSLSSRLPQPQVLSYILKRGKFLFETDAPFQKPTDMNAEEHNHLKNLIWVVDKVAATTAISKEILKRTQFDTLNWVLK